MKEKAKGTIFNTVNLCIWLMTAGLVDNEHILISYRCFAGHCSCMWCSTNAVFVFLAADSMTKKCSGCFCHSFVISQEWWQFVHCEMCWSINIPPSDWTALCDVSFMFCNYCCLYSVSRLWFHLIFAPNTDHSVLYVNIYEYLWLTLHLSFSS